ncbi:D-aspartate oxidase-like, partial [Paramuricea clavata]
FKDVVVGGTAQRGNWDTNVDERETQAILDRVAEFEPTIKKGTIIDQWVGLRPVRDSVRLEKEVMDVKTQYGSKLKLQVVHNYGHGGAGLSLFWGCAEETKDLVLTTLLHSGL